MRRGDVMRVGGHAVAAEARVDAPAPRPAVLRVLDDQERGGLPDGHAAPIAVEGTARRGIEQLERVEAHEADVGQRVHAAHQRGRGHARADEIGAQRDRGRAGGTGHDHRLLGPVRPRRQPRVSACENGRIERSAPIRDEGRPRASPSTSPRPRACRRRPRRRGAPPPRAGAVQARVAPGPRPRPRARSGPRASVGGTPSVPYHVGGGTSAAMRERKPSVSMTVMGLIAQVPAASPVQKLFTPRCRG